MEPTARDYWSRYHLGKALNVEGAPYSPSNGGYHDVPSIPFDEDGNISVPDKFEFNFDPQDDGSSGKKVCIVGAGAAGLFTAMLFDYINARYLKELDNRPIEYDIYEAGEGVGGRLYTWKFSEQPHDYYDVGAMRFPENKIMKRTFCLFDYLKMEKFPDPKPDQDLPLGSLIPYYMEGENEPWYFNDISKTGDYKDFAVHAANYDPFSMSDQNKQSISEKVLRVSADRGPGAFIGDAIKPYVDAIKRDESKGWETLMSIDAMSTTEFLAMGSPAPNKGDPTQPELNYNSIEFLETFNGGTSWYDQAHSETVLEYMDFHTDPGEKWWCIEGGANELAVQMLKKVKNQSIKFKKRITGIDIGKGERDMAKVKISDELGDEWQDKAEYSGVFNSTTLGCMQQMDLVNAGLTYGQKQAIRSLGYGPSTKVGIKFKEPWWMTTFKISKGGLGHSDTPTRTTVYPSYNIRDSKTGTAVLLATYQWQQDAQRLGAYMSTSPDYETRRREEVPLKEQLLRDLAKLHSKQPMADPTRERMTAQQVYDMIEPLYDDHYAHDWYHDRNTFGAFAFYRPQQFGSMWPYIVQPSPRLVMVGEHASNHHAWVVGALESVVHGVHGWLSTGPFHRAKDIADAMERWEGPTAENPFGGLPQFAEKKQRDLQAVISKYQTRDFFKQRMQSEAAR